MDKELEKILIDFTSECVVAITSYGGRPNTKQAISQLKSLFKKKAKECEPYISEYRKGDGEKENLFKMGFSRCNKEWYLAIDQKFK